MSALTDRIDPYSMEGEALVLGLNQFTHGTRSCVYCEADAMVSLATGAHPEQEPMCWTCARPFIAQVIRIGDDVWAAK